MIEVEASTPSKREKLLPKLPHLKDKVLENLGTPSQKEILLKDGVNHMKSWIS